jgi:glutamate formiminotransferase/formiminotetrahydrofolate cyclodeaminase
MKLIECVPNFSEGRDLAVIKQITDAIEAVEGVKLLDVDPGASTNRTVVTFVGSPEAVVEGAFQGIKKAGELIDMRKQKGTHPRMGATDVCPLIPISEVSEEEAIQYAHQLAERVGKELKIPVYLYEKAASSPQRQNLAVIREGEYEGFAEKIYQAAWKPDYGPQEYNAFSGQTVIGVRDFLVAYNINLNSQSTRRANSVAFDIREKGRLKTVDGKPGSPRVKDENGKYVRQPGACKYVKAIGWYVEEYGIAQVSANLTNITETPVHVVFEEARKSANRRGLRVTGSELIGLIPKQAMVDAGLYYLAQQGVSQGVSERDLIHLAVKSLGLDELSPFDPDKKIIEYAIAADQAPGLADLTIKAFDDLLASDAPAPGGGSAAALVGSLAAGLGTMVANLSGNKRGWDDRTEAFGAWGRKGQQLKDRLVWLIDEDTASFNKVMEANRLPKGTAGEQAERQQAIEQANQYAASVPFMIVETAFACYELLEYMASEGLGASITDVGVGVHCAHTAIEGASLNVRINLGDIQDQAFCDEMLKKVADYRARSESRKAEILEVIEGRM